MEVQWQVINPVSALLGLTFQSPVFKVAVETEEELGGFDVFILLGAVRHASKGMILPCTIVRIERDYRISIKLKMTNLGIRLWDDGGHDP